MQARMLDVKNGCYKPQRRICHCCIMTVVAAHQEDARAEL